MASGTKKDAPSRSKRDDTRTSSLLDRSAVQSVIDSVLKKMDDRELHWLWLRVVRECERRGLGMRVVWQRRKDKGGSSTATGTTAEPPASKQTHLDALVHGANGASETVALKPQKG